MAKARIAPSNQRPQRPALPGASGGSGRSGPLGYLRGVWEELKKVVWPARDELLRMTGIVIATVIIFAALVGGTDYILSLGHADARGDRRPNRGPDCRSNRRPNCVAVAVVGE
jgi:preprotein translocase subunit SecE